MASGAIFSSTWWPKLTNKLKVSQLRSNSWSTGVVKRSKVGQRDGTTDLRVPFPSKSERLRRGRVLSWLWPPSPLHGGAEEKRTRCAAVLPNLVSVWWKKVSISAGFVNDGFARVSPCSEKRYPRRSGTWDFAEASAGGVLFRSTCSMNYLIMLFLVDERFWTGRARQNTSVCERKRVSRTRKLANDGWVDSSTRKEIYEIPMSIVVKDAAS